MTNEEAIDALSSEKEAYILNIDGKPTICYSAKRIRALEMAIKALQTEPCEDAISRQEVLEEINRIGINAFVTYNDYSGLFDFVDTLPSVTPATENDKFLEFLWNTINPNEMEQYLAMYHAKEEKTNG